MPYGALPVLPVLEEKGHLCGCQLWCYSKLCCLTCASKASLCWKKLMINSSFQFSPYSVRKNTCMASKPAKKEVSHGGDASGLIPVTKSSRWRNHKKFTSWGFILRDTKIQREEAERENVKAAGEELAPSKTPQVPVALATGWKTVASRDPPDNGTKSVIIFNAQLDNWFRPQICAVD